ncbi:N-acetylmuramidase domain-containing protein [Aliihoeflea sp. PC F10.4]
MLQSETRNAIAHIAKAFDLDPAALAAVAHIESNLVTHADIDGRREPLIRFEGHYFDRRLSGLKLERARQQGLASPRAGAVKNPASQTARWKLLAAARAIDRKAADESTSWGIGQVMGAHWAWLGYATVDALVTEARDGVDGQLRLMARYIVRAGLRNKLASRDWAAFARAYNGPGFSANAYDTKLARAFAIYEKLDWQLHAASLRRGDRGEAVADLQRRLVERGAAIAIDGMFGPATEGALRAFQTANRLAATGVADVSTLKILESRPNPLARVMSFLRSLRVA